MSLFDPLLSAFTTTVRSRSPHARFEIGDRDDDPETDLRAEIEADLQKLIDADRWELVHGLIAAWEKDAAKTPFSMPFHRIGAEVALAPILGIAEASHATGIRPSSSHIDSAIAAFEARMIAEPDSHVAAVLAARAHFAAGWEARGDGWIQQVPQNDLLRMEHHFNAAERILSRFAMIGSSLVAEARYFLCLGLEDGHALIRKRYEDWIATDRDDLTPFAMHGFHLLPRWFGSLAELEREAHRAAEATAPTHGTAGYAVFHLGVEDCTDEARTTRDPDLFVRAALDRARTAGSQYGVNRMAEVLMLAMLETRGETRALYRDGLAQLVRDHLRVLVSTAWSHPLAEVRRELARLFKPDLDAGRHIRITAAGFEILDPHAEARAPT